MSHFICLDIVQLLSAAHKNVECKESQRINLLIEQRQFIGEAVFADLLCKLIPYDFFQSKDECDGLRRGELLDSPYPDDIIKKHRNLVLIDSLEEIFKDALYSL